MSGAERAASSTPTGSATAHVSISAVSNPLSRSPFRAFCEKPASETPRMACPIADIGHDEMLKAST